MNIQRIWYEYRKNILNLNQDTLDVRLPQGAALIFQQKGMLHAGLGQNFHFLDYFLKGLTLVQALGSRVDRSLLIG